jgi:replicative DNA helicase
MTDRLPPHNIEAEEAVLGSILIDNEAMAEVMVLVRPDDFYRDKNRMVYEAFLSLYERGQGIDQVTAAQEMTREGTLEDVGGWRYLAHLAGTVPTSVHARYYAGIVGRLAYARRMIVASGEIAGLAYEGKDSSIDLFVEAQQRIGRLEPEGRDILVNPKGHAETMLTMLTKRREMGITDCVFYGYTDLDRHTGGMQGGEFIIIGARPSVGKTQILLEVALHNANNGKMVLFCSAEMTLTQLTEREIVMGTGIDIRRLRRGELTEDEWGSSQGVVGKVADMPLYFVIGRLNVMRIIQKAKQLKQTKDLDLLLVDYIQLLGDRSDKRCGDTLRERIGYISNSLKNAANELEIAVVAASQFSRGVEIREGHRPMLSDLKESGDLEQDADVVLLLHRPEMYPYEKDYCQDEDKGVLEIKVAKMRQLGLEQTVKLIWVEDQHRYRDKAK